MMFIICTLRRLTVFYSVYCKIKVPEIAKAIADKTQSRYPCIIGVWSDIIKVQSQIRLFGSQAHLTYST